MSKLKLEKAIHFHGQYLLSSHHDEAALDDYYLKLKEMRRKAHNIPHPEQVSRKKKLLHMRVTPQGLVQVDDVDDGRHDDQKKAAHFPDNELKAHLLFEDHGLRQHRGR